MHERIELLPHDLSWASKFESSTGGSDAANGIRALW